jgi:hypothetical protein
MLFLFIINEINHRFGTVYVVFLKLVVLNLKGEVIEDVPTLSARIEEKQKRLENRKGQKITKFNLIKHS